MIGLKPIPTRLEPGIALSPDSPIYKINELVAVVNYLLEKDKQREHPSPG